MNENTKIDKPREIINPGQVTKSVEEETKQVIKATPVEEVKPEYIGSVFAKASSDKDVQPREGQFVKVKPTIRHKAEHETDVKKRTKREEDFIKDEYHETVTGTIVNHEQPGNTIEFWFRGNGCPDITKFEFGDNTYVKMAVGVAEHLNKNCWIGKDKDALDDAGKQIIATGRKLRRFTFYPSGYFGPIDLSPC